MKFNFKKTALALLLTGTVALMSFSDSSAGKGQIGEAGAVSGPQTTAISLAEQEGTPMRLVTRWINEIVNNIMEAATLSTGETEQPAESIARMKMLSSRKMNQL